MWRLITGRRFFMDKDLSPVHTSPTETSLWIFSLVRLVGLPLQAGERYSLDEIFLCYKKHDNYWNGHYKGTSHNQCRIVGNHYRGGHMYGKRVKTKRQGIKTLVGNVNKRSQEVVPRCQECKNTHDDQGGFDKGHHYAPVNQEMSRTIDTGCVFQVFRDTLEKLPEQEYVERGRKRGTQP